MSVGEICTRNVVVAARDDTVQEAARLMRRHHVGDLVVVDEKDGKRVPVGIVTDRDLVLEVMAMDLDPASVKVGEIMGPELVAVREGDGIFDTMRYMCAKGVRRLPTLAPDGSLAGIVALDDLIELLGDEIGQLARLLRLEKTREDLSRK